MVKTFWALPGCVALLTAVHILIAMQVFEKSRPGRCTRPYFDDLGDDLLHIIVAALEMKRCSRFGRTCKRIQGIWRIRLETELNLAPEQVACFLDAMRGENVLITGSAGTGKSHTLKMIIKHLGDENVAVTAATGAAAAVIGASTFHSTCALGLGKAPVPLIVKRVLENPFAHARLRKLKVLVVDEAGMLSASLFDKAGDVVGAVHRAYGTGYQAIMENTLPTVPFDDVQLILSGDFLQLPPVDTEDGSGFIFQSKCWPNLHVKTHVLRMVHRQQDVRFIHILQRMRLGVATQEDINYLHANSAQVPNPGALKLYSKNAPADSENETRLAEIHARTHIFRSIDSGANANMSDEHVAEVLKHSSAPKVLALKVGARVMCLKNIDRRLVNGSTGTVVLIFPTYDENERLLLYVNVRVQFDGQLGEDGFEYTFESHIAGSEVKQENHFTISGHDNVKRAQRIQLPLRLAWAISIHKSQGKTLDAVDIDFLNTFMAGQAYTALSRVKTLAGAYLRGLKLSHMHMVNSKALRFYNSLGCGCK